MAMSLADFMRGHVAKTSNNDDDMHVDPNAPSCPIDFKKTHVKIPEDENTMFSAVRYNDVQMIDRLLREGVDINIIHEGDVCMVRSSRLFTSLRMQRYAPLHVACLHSSIKIVEHLLENGADVNICDKVNRTPLHLAAATKRYDIVKLLLAKDANTNIQTSSGKTPLMNAVLVSHIEIVQALIDAKCDLEIQDIKGSSALYLAISPRTLKDSSGYEIMKLLIKAGAMVDAQNHLKATPLMLAVGLHSVDVIKLLLDSGADINHKDNKGISAFHYSCRSNRMEVAWLLARHGADINCPDKSGRTPIQKSIEFMVVPVIMNLLMMDCIRDNTQFQSEAIRKICDRVPVFQEFLKNEMTQPWTLMRLCRFNIRNELLGYKVTEISELPIPRFLMDYLMLK